jgi:nitrite reductase/ring-hydroxylating ferredoxin subunit
VSKFIAVARLEQLDSGKPLVVELGRTSVALFRSGERVFALDDTCSHSGGPLSEAEACDGFALCSWHGARFALDTGRCAGPPASRDVRSYVARSRDGVIELEQPD